MLLSISNFIKYILYVKKKAKYIFFILVKY